MTIAKQIKTITSAKSLQLLTAGSTNTKMSKSQKKQFKVYSLNLRPHETEINGKIYNVCPFATKGCSKACVGDNGHFAMKNGSAYAAQLRKTELYFQDTEAFYFQLYAEIEYLRERFKKQGKKLVLRLNAYSDINHAKQSKRYTGKSIFAAFPDVVFYDYTKDRKKAINNIYGNYSLTYSHNEETTIDKSVDTLNLGINVAIVFELSPDGNLPETFCGFPVHDGDKDDKRFLDPVCSWVGLKFKGSADNLLSAVASGFCIPYAMWRQMP